MGCFVVDKGSYESDDNKGSPCDHNGKSSDSFKFFHDISILLAVLFLMMYTDCFIELQFT